MNTEQVSVFLTDKQEHTELIVTLYDSRPGIEWFFSEYGDDTIFYNEKTNCYEMISSIYKYWLNYFETKINIEDNERFLKRFFKDNFFRKLELSCDGYEFTESDSLYLNALTDIKSKLEEYGIE